MPKLKKLMDEEKKSMKKAKVMPMLAEPEHMKPHVYISSDDVPEIKNWKVGGTYTLKVRQKSRTISEGEGKTKFSGEFEVIGVEGEADEKKEDVKLPPLKSKYE